MRAWRRSSTGCWQTRSVPESPEELHARVQRGADSEDRLPLPSYTSWDTFPWDGVTGARPLAAPVYAEPAREGEGGVGCSRCADPDRNVIWRNDRWMVCSTSKPTGIPLVLFLMPREHLDFTDLGEDMAAECGRISLWLARIVEGLPHIARCHVLKIGDGVEHLHLWFMARPARFPQLRGSFLAEWDDILQPVPEDGWRADLARVAAHLATHDGRAMA